MWCSLVYLLWKQSVTSKRYYKALQYTHCQTPIDIISLLNAFTVYVYIDYVYSRSPRLHRTNTVESDINMHVHRNISYLTAPSHVTTSGPQAAQNTGAIYQ